MSKKKNFDVNFNLDDPNAFSKLFNELLKSALDDLSDEEGKPSKEPKEPLVFNIKLEKVNKDKVDANPNNDILFTDKDENADINYFDKSNPQVQFEDNSVFYDVLNNNDSISLVADLKNTDPSEIKISIDSNSLFINVDTEELDFHRSIDANFNIDPKNIEYTYKNGILDLKIKKGKRIRPVKSEFKIN